MSVSTGPELSDLACELLGGRGADGTAVRRVIQALTVNDAGFPHVALLSPGEVAVLAPDRLRVALYASGTTIRNLAERPRLTLVVIEPECCCYVMGEATPAEMLPDDPLMPVPVRRVDVSVRDVLVDSEAGAGIERGARYSRDVPLETELAYWARSRAGLSA